MMFVALLRQVIDWNPAAVGREPAADPRSIHANKRIVATDGWVEYRLIKHRIETGAPARPHTSPRPRCFGFTCPLPPPPTVYGHNSKTSQAPQARHSRHKPVRQSRFRQQVLKGLPCHSR